MLNKKYWEGPFNWTKSLPLKDLTILSEMLNTHSTILPSYMKQAKCHRTEEMHLKTEGKEKLYPTEGYQKGHQAENGV